MMNMSPLQRYMAQMAASQQGVGPRGSGGQPAAPVGPGIADPYTQGDIAPPLTNPDDDQNEFDPRRRPYMGGQ